MDSVYLRLLRFKCYDVERTVEFYTTLGMVALGIVETEAIVYSYFSHDVGSSQRMDVSPGAIAVRFEYTRGEELLGSVPTERAAHLVFYAKRLVEVVAALEEKGFVPHVRPQKFQRVKIAIMNDPNGLQVRIVQCTDQQMRVMGTRNQQPPARRLGGGSRGVSSSVMMKAAARIRATAAKWVTKLGYIVLPCVSMQRTVKFFQDGFSIIDQDAILRMDASRTPPSHLDEDGSDTMSTMSSLTSIPSIAKISVPAELDERAAMRDAAAAYVTPLAERVPRSGFKVVDVEDFAHYRVSYNWMGHDERTECTTVAFVQKVSVASRTSTGDGGIAQSEGVQAMPRAFLGFVFGISSVSLLKPSTGDESNVLLAPRFSIDLGTIGDVFRVYDPNGYAVDITDNDPYCCRG